MKAYKNSGFQDRVDQVAKAKQRLIEKLRDKPEVDPAAEEARLLASQKREAAQAEKRAQRKAAEAAAEQAARDSKAASEEAEAARLAAIKPEPTEEERKAARDARYAARKKRR
ncbi:DUF6481 family protein [Sphingomonas glaciei]|uniref:DUF6481 family protein n=1 Tax=Sphingomonas glaciei TaxID=2938948 RepID=A0ABY5MUK0_9SPHN|nr:DUF6481 family protein [Sphingomonas glaciei]UUR08169.1 DUF6481 family protein [Sphingomonas glaciei]